MSTNGHAIPEQMFDNPDTPEKEAEGISAVKALQIAGQQGQTLYTINSKKQSTILPKLKGHSATVMQDVRNALYANKTITISESPIQYKTWKGTGYIILDNDTGAGAYLIGSGEDGMDFVNSENSLLISSLAINASEAAFYDAQLNETARPIHSSLLIKKLNLAHMAQRLSYLGLGLSLALIVSDESLTTNQKIFQISTSLFAFGVGAYIAMSAFGLLPLGGAIALVLLVTIALAIITYTINNMYVARIKGTREFRGSSIS